VLAASPRAGGACARLAAAAARAARGAGAAVEELSLAGCDLQGCVGCGACARTGACRYDARERGLERERAAGAPVTAAGLLGRIEGARALVLVAPLYFAGPPSQLKALLDRMQPWWARRYVLGAGPALPPARRRPWGLVCVGGGGDPFGAEPLVASCRSALRMLDFELADRCDLVGCASDGPGFSAAERRVSDWADAFARAALPAPDPAPGA
jgi:NAD(P)H-dependent FMN reductase